MAIVSVCSCIRAVFERRVFITSYDCLDLETSLLISAQAYQSHGINVKVTTAKNVRWAGGLPLTETYTTTI